VIIWITGHVYTKTLGSVHIWTPTVAEIEGSQDPHKIGDAACETPCKPPLPLFSNLLFPRFLLCSLTLSSIFFPNLPSPPLPCREGPLVTLVDPLPPIIYVHLTSHFPNTVMKRLVEEPDNSIYRLHS